MSLLIENVWQNVPENMRTRIANLWLEAGALPNKEAALQRTQEVVLVAHDGAGIIAGVNTVRKLFVPRLKNHFWYYRTFIASPYRRSHIASELGKQARVFLSERYAAGNDPEILGLYTKVESPYLQQLRHAVWPATRMAYIGEDEAGNHLRVYYFEGAKI